MRELNMDYCIQWWQEQFSLQDGPRYSFSRFGDGEIACMLGSGPSNCDKHPYTKELAEDLIRAFTQPHLHKVVYGIQRMVMEKRAAEIAGLFSMIGDVSMPGMTAGDVFHHMSMRGQLRPVMDFMSRKPWQVCLVGPDHIQALPWVRQHHYLSAYVHVPKRNCYSEMDRVLEEIEEAYLQGCKFFSLSCSMMAEVIIHKVTPVLPMATFIDFGSMWDPYCGVQSRTYHKRHTTEEWLEMLNS
jgi:hypothetical protein